MKTIRLLLVIVLVLSVMFKTDSRQGYALLIKMSIEDLTSQADYILLGEVADIEARANSEGKMIFTYVKIAVEKMIKGETSADELSLKLPGGTAGDMSMWVEDVPEFKLGERAVLFLNVNEAGEYQILGGIQGKYSVAANDQTFEKDMSLDEFKAELQNKLENKSGECNE